MALDRKKYINKFAEEGLDNISIAQTLLFEIKDRGSNLDDIATLMRALHTLKGTSRMLDFKNLEIIAHALETVFIAFKEEKISLNDKAIRLIFAGMEEIKTGIEKIKTDSSDEEVRAEIFQKELLSLSSNEEFEIPSNSQIHGEKKQDDESNFNKLEEAKSGSIRISLQKINGVIRDLASLQSLEITARNMAKDTEAIDASSRYLSRLAGIELSWNSPLLREFRALELMISKLGSIVKNYTLDVGNYIRDAYDSVVTLRMLPLSTALEAYPGYVLNIAGELGKKAEIQIYGSENEIDKNLIESLSEVFLHMIRNSIDHGIEKPQDRLSCGKNESGLIVIRCIRESGNMKITITDDGKGIDTEAIRKKIIDTGLVTKENAAVLNEEELINFIFQSGFSTSASLTDVSGRGVGMDAVKSNIERMKGSISIQSKLGEGTIFTISVPLSLAALMGFPIICGEMKFIVPANFVDTVIIIDSKEIIMVLDRPGINYNGKMIKLFYLHHILKIPSDQKKNSDSSVFVIIVHSYEETVAIAVDQISSMRQVILKNMPPLMENIDVFSGVVLSEDYELIPALHIPTVVSLAKRTKTIDMKTRHVEYERTSKSILVVDDSSPTREVMRDILETEGYNVDTAADGSEALAAAKNFYYDLICTDINMPYMDGFQLAENIRKNENLKSTPIIIISSMEDDKEQNKANVLGVNRYIVKSSFSDLNLITAVRELIGDVNG
ncbi:MAG: response regulator [Treponema sp.]|nr:response regulator [Treponema sp.]MCL2237205.1 response regulator [Treponema sp.]